MEARFMIESPDEIQATMKITMSIKEWTELRDELAKLETTYLISKLSSKITDLIIQARKVFYTIEG
jgi:hypothetical protein